ncbi:unnamed protein product [Didymodactylos carnosus]|uniref:Uncharacterized protein n=1 Tax=Didymodactylos carnosus TaxID=1234261 RepID=A0A814YRP3_9BILA|nr:unnamed protein product [Didymodactylos carnosus]CAF1235521.1 unnamed protein product [Didymodactylos carnosus]CAF3996533.1 unnamed protein product [Didymodactylos carnosus]CAF4043353.1 unnamed protein product [Didymodactylos carnosus]
MEVDTCLIWLDEIRIGFDIGLRSQLRRINKNLFVFFDEIKCLNYIEKLSNEKSFKKIHIAMLDGYCTTTIPVIHDKKEIYAIYIFCSDKTNYEKLLVDYPKIRAISTSTDHIIDILQDQIYPDNLLREHQSISKYDFIVDEKRQSSAIQDDQYFDANQDNSSRRKMGKRD